MTDWKKTDYGTPKTWNEIREEQVDAELAKKSASPLPMLTLAALLLACVVAGLSFILWSAMR